MKPTVDKRRWIEDLAAQFMAGMLANTESVFFNSNDMARVAFKAARAFAAVAAEQEYDPAPKPTPTPI